MHLKLLAKKTFRPRFQALIFVALSLSQSASSYVKFPSKPVDSWDSLFTLSGADKYYTVQKGDTLYDISATLFGDPNFWPKIWSLNAKITNPHIIEKGQLIYFVGGTTYTPPRIGISILKPESYTYGNHFLSPEIPPEDVKKGPIPIPKTLPNYFRAISASEEINLVNSISSGNRVARNALRKIEVSSEITNQSPVSVGKIERVFTGAKYAVVGDLVYLKVFSGAAVGDEFAIYKTRPKWLPLRVKPRHKANLVEWLGKVKIKSTAEGGYAAEVVHANSIIQVGENLALREIKSIELPSMIDEAVLTSTIDGKTKVIGAHKIAGATVVGENQIVYLNSGSSAGIEQGKIYPLYTNFGEVGISKPESFVPKRIGFVKIASVENGVSTGVAFNLISEVQVDQSIGL